MTGIYNSRNYGEFGILGSEETTFGHLFKRAGYKTCVAGKWQLGGGFEGPGHLGFDEYCLWQLTRGRTDEAATCRCLKVFIIFKFSTLTAISICH